MFSHVKAKCNGYCTAYKSLAGSAGSHCTGYIAFDMDGTIITTKSGKAFPVDGSDWKFWDSSVPEVMRKHHKEGMTSLTLNLHQIDHNTISQWKRNKTDILSLFSYVE
jgi:Polynucleotide kinase 3 phosphatase